MARNLLLNLAAGVSLVAACQREGAHGIDEPTATSDSDVTATGTTDATTDDSSTTDASTHGESSTSASSAETGGSACGDAILDLGEECDDGNESSFDGCSATCTVEHPISRLVMGPSAGHACILLEDMRLKCWGWNGLGALGLGDKDTRGDEAKDMGAALPYVETGMASIVQLSAAANQTCARSASGELKCWGDNSVGQLGLGQGKNGNMERPPSRWGDEPGEMGNQLPFVELGAPALSISHHGPTACATLSGGGVKCWGRNDTGALGLGDTEDRGDEPGEMGEALPFVDVGMDVVGLAGHDGMTCAWDDVGRVKCWGNNSVGELGIGDAGNHRGDEPGEMGDALPFIDLGTGAKAVMVATAEDSTCAVLASGVVKCWGLGLPAWSFPWPNAPLVTGAGPGEMGDNLPPLQAGASRAIVEVGVGSRFACVRMSDGGVRCWGYNAEGQLGQGHSDAVSEPLEEIPDIDLGESARQLAVGHFHACVLLESGNVKCWGAGGALGLGDEDHRGDEPGEMGTALPYVALF